MAELADGSVLVAQSKGDRFFASTAGQLVRLVDSNNDGVADEQSILFDDVPGGGLSALRMAGNLIFASGQGRGKPISILRTGPTPADPLTLVGSIQINYSGDWLHPHSALAARTLPGQPGKYELCFQLGSSENATLTTRTLELTSTIGVAGPLKGDGFYRITLSDDGQTVTGSALTQIATGLRNAAGFDFQPGTGDLYLQDNGIDGLVDVNESHSADELNFITSDALGGTIEDFGYPDNYTRYRTGEFVGGGDIAPLVTFQPLPDPQTGKTSIAFSVPDLGGVLPVSLKVYGLNGQLVATLADQTLQPGAYQVRWDGRDQRGAPVASGVYLCQLKVGQQLQATQRMTLLK